MKTATQTIYAHREGMLALKPERLARLAQMGGVILDFGDEVPSDAILLTDCRPLDFIGGRNANDPTDTAIYIGSGPFSGKYVTRRKNFEQALTKAISLSKATV